MTFYSPGGILGGYGELSERFKEPVLKTGDSERNLGFESLTLRHKRNLFCLPGQERFLIVKIAIVWYDQFYQLEFDKGESFDEYQNPSVR